MTLGSDGQIISDAATDTEKIAELEKRIEGIEIELQEFISKVSPGKAYREGIS